MKKKEYIKPELNVYKMETTSILAGSEIMKAKEEDYSEGSVRDYRDASGSIWADKKASPPIIMIPHGMSAMGYYPS